MRNLVYLLCWLPWDSGDKLSSSNNSRETVIYLNFGVINRSAVHSSTWRWDSSHLPPRIWTSRPSSSCSKQGGVGFFRFIKPVLECVWEVPMSTSGLCREPMGTRWDTAGSCPQIEESSPKVTGMNLVHDASIYQILRRRSPLLQNCPFQLLLDFLRSFKVMHGCFDLMHKCCASDVYKRTETRWEQEGLQKSGHSLLSRGWKEELNFWGALVQLIFMAKVS